MNKFRQIDIKLFVKYTSLIIVFLYFAYSIFYSISENDAGEIARKLLVEKYSTICWWGFEKNLTLGTRNSRDYDFTSDNDRCELYIFVSRFWYTESGVMPKD